MIYNIKAINLFQKNVKKEKSINVQPPKNRWTVKPAIKSIEEYSPKKNKEKLTAEYSTLYPETNSASASGRSKGWRLVSAKAHIRKIINEIGR
jgi:hypothetical protein